MTDHPPRVETTKEWKSTFELQPSPHRNGSGFQFPQVATLSTPSHKKKVIREKETIEVKRPLSLGVNHCCHPKLKNKVVAKEPVDEVLPATMSRM